MPTGPSLRARISAAVLAFTCFTLTHATAADGPPTTQPTSKPAAPAPPRPTRPPLPHELLTLAGHHGYLILPPNTKPGQPIPWVWYAPCLASGSEVKWFEKFVAAGIAVAAIDGGDLYSDPKSHPVYDAFYKELTEKHGLAKRFAFLPRSRGGWLAYSWAFEHPDTVTAIGGIYPVSDLTTKQIAPLINAHVPLFHLHGEPDERVPLEKNSAKLARDYKSLGGDMKLTVIKDQGHNVWTGWFQNQELTDFLIAHALENTAPGATTKPSAPRP